MKNENFHVFLPNAPRDWALECEVCVILIYFTSNWIYLNTRSWSKACRITFMQRSDLESSAFIVSLLNRNETLIFWKEVRKKNWRKNAIFKWIMYSQIFCSHYWWNVAISWTLLFVKFEIKEKCNRSLISWQRIREMQMMKLHLG